MQKAYQDETHNETLQSGLKILAKIIAKQAIKDNLVSKEILNTGYPPLKKVSTFELYQKGDLICR